MDIATNSGDEKNTYIIFHNESYYVTQIPLRASVLCPLKRWYKKQHFEHLQEATVSSLSIITVIIFLPGTIQTEPLTVVFLHFRWRRWTSQNRIWNHRTRLFLNIWGLMLWCKGQIKVKGNEARTCVVHHHEQWISFILVIYHINIISYMFTMMLPTVIDKNVLYWMLNS